MQDKDYWRPLFERFRLSDSPQAKEIQALFVGLVQENFRKFSASGEMQRIILWQISEGSPLMKTLAEEREVQGNALLKMAMPYFRESGVSFKAVIALLLGGSYYMVLQHGATGGTFCGMDLRSEKDRSDVLEAIEKIVEWSWQYAGENQNGK